MRMSSTYQHLCPCLLELAKVCLSLLVSNAWPEHGASAIKRLKTRLQSTLKTDMLNALLQVSINGPEVKDCQPLITTAVKEWFLEQELECAEALLKLPPEKEGSFDSVSEWENSDSELSNQDDLN